MKILVGLSPNLSETDIRQVCEAGAGEFFAGVVPEGWSRIYGYQVSPNRREYAANNFLDFDRLSHSIDTAHGCGAAVFITFNAVSYAAEHMPLLLDYLRRVADIGADGVIVADPALMLLIGDLDLGLEIHVSGEAGVYNSETADFYHRLGARRIILPRHLTVAEIGGMIQALGDRLDFEAFILSQRCSFNAAYCTAAHGWDQLHYCSTPFRDSLRPSDPHRWHQPLNSISHVRRHTGDQAVQAYIDEQRLSPGEVDRYNRNHAEYEKWKWSADHGALTCARSQAIRYCGLCAIPYFARLGVVSLKVVSRGDRADSIVQRVELVKKVVDRGDDADPEFCREVLGLSELCEEGYRCYYRDGVEIAGGKVRVPLRTELPRGWES
jgi:collagenase-like PrtC family protease